VQTDDTFSLQDEENKMKIKNRKWAILNCLGLCCFGVLIVLWMIVVMYYFDYFFNVLLK
jgi:uncharacterized membrane protein